MKPVCWLAAALVAGAALVAAEPAHAGPTRKVSCATVAKRFPNGVASSTKAAKAYASATGVKVPVNRPAFSTFARLDRDRDGVICARRSADGSSTPPSLPTLAPGDSAQLRPAAECKLTTQSGARPVSLGFDRPLGRTPSSGPVKATVLLVDFPNAPAQESAAARYNAVVPGALAILDSASYGRLSMQAAPQLSWVRMPKSSSEYGLGRGVSFAQHKAYIEDAIAAAGSSVDYSATDVIIIVSAANAPDMANSPAFTPFPGGGVVAGGKRIDNGVTVGTDFPGRQDRVLAHELLHTLGLVDLYSFADPSKLFQFTGPFSIMGDVTTPLPGPSAWERWVLGWIDDRQVACVGGTEATITLEPVSRAGTGVKAAVVSGGDGTAVVVEARSTEGMDAGGPGGVVVYSVDPRVGSGYGPIRMATDGGTVRGPLQAGESVTVGRATVTVVSGGAQPQVRITVAG